MKLLMYTVRDKAVGSFLPPFYVRAAGEALRSFTEAVNDVKSNFAKYPDDFTLFCLGSFDDGSGMFDTVEPQRVVSARDVFTNVVDVSTS